MIGKQKKKYVNKHILTVKLFGREGKNENSVCKENENSLCTEIDTGQTSE